jgi:hypothetical protein
MSEQRGCGGCISDVIGLFVVIFVLLWLLSRTSAPSGVNPSHLDDPPAVLERVVDRPRR